MSSGTGDRNPNDGPPQPRQPRNLQDLVRYSIEANPSQRQTTPPDAYSHLTEDRRRFLEGAFQDLARDVTKELVDAIAILKKYPNPKEDNSTFEAALDVIADLVDNIDCAKDFCKLGGFDVATACFSSDCSEIRWRMCDIIAQCTQNNPFSQEYAVRCNFLQPLLLMVDKDNNEKCRIKAFFAVSNIVRDNPDGLKEFLKHDGFSVVLRAMQSNIEKLRTKSTFFLSSIVTQNVKVIGDIYNMGFIEQLISLLHREHSPVHEHIVSTLLTIVKNYKPAQAECQRPELMLRSTLKSLLHMHGRDDAFQEEVGYIRELMKLVFSDDSEEER